MLNKNKQFFQVVGLANSQMYPTPVSAVKWPLEAHECLLYAPQCLKRRKYFKSDLQNKIARKYSAAVASQRWPSNMVTGVSHARELACARVTPSPHNTRLPAQATQTQTQTRTHPSPRRAAPRHMNIQNRAEKMIVKNIPSWWIHPFLLPPSRR